MTYERTYRFTNENLSSYQKLFEFKDADVLSVIGSGDQYFSSLLFGAKRTVLFDKNEISKLYFLLKYYSIKNLSYEEFYDYFINQKVKNEKYYKKIRKFLPNDVKFYFDRVYEHNISILFPLSLNSHPINYNTGRVIPYLDKKNYYRLQTILKLTDPPIIKTEYLEHLNMHDIGSFDIMLFSNIYTYLSMSNEEFLEMLKRFKKNLKNNGKIQADYIWSIEKKNEMKFINKEEFELTEVESVRYDGKTDFKDYVLTYKK